MGGRNQQSRDAARPPLQRSSGQDYISTDSGEERKRFSMCAATLSQTLLGAGESLVLAPSAGSNC